MAEFKIEQQEGINNCTVLLNRHYPDVSSVFASLELLSRQRMYAEKTVVLFEPDRLSGYNKNWWQKVAAFLNDKGIKRLVLAGMRNTPTSVPLRAKVEHHLSPAGFANNFTTGKFKNEAILICGHPSDEMEQILQQLQNKTHNTVLEVNLNSLGENVEYFRSCLETPAKLIAVVKASCYGIGSFDIPFFLEDHQADLFAVAYTDEGVELREAGIKLPVLVMSPDPDSFFRLTDYDLEPELFSFRGLTLFNRVLQNKGIENYPVHLKLDTGMHRLGFLPCEVDRLIEECKKLERITVRSVFSHLSVADEPQHDEFTLEQFGKFAGLSDRIEKGLGYPVLRHILNSPGIERFPGYGFDMIRLGIGMYGVSALENNTLQNVCTLKSRISRIKHLQPGDSVGYGRKHRVSRPQKIAVGAAGYADGLNRKLGNGNWEVIVKGKPVPVIGNICMDSCIIDITGIDACEGDEVILFGESNNIIKMADVLETIPYEVLTGVSRRVRRVFVRG